MLVLAYCQEKEVYSVILVHARKQIAQGQRQKEVAALFNVNRSTLHRSLVA
jgi:hypothetical protein